ncbi:MAG: type II toxin-antitoxin system RelB/DinJ family antitoxin [Erysipelotrichaceae bacterium]|nr:type II toxin-antitoxin system RelB/DinJ family antitoxin [Erysipelotrichaceae bacterium]
MPKVSTNITLDPDLKKAAQELFLDLGMDLSTAITLFLKQSVREQRVPFAITRAVPNAETISALQEYNAMRSDYKQYKRYDSFSELLDEVKENA